MRRWAAGLAVTGLVWFASPPPAEAATTLFTLRDPRLSEVSGIARGVVSPGVFYIQNDSGDTARFFALGADDGRVRAEYDVSGTAAVDWEDLAVATDASGRSSVWLADIGDNSAARAEVEIYRVDEPRVSASSRPITLAAPQVWRLRYPDGAHDAESLAVAPGGRAYVITKNGAGPSGVYAVPSTPSPAANGGAANGGASDGAVQTMRKIASVTFDTGLDRLATGAAFSRYGSRLVVRTYTAAYVWAVRDGDVAGALRRAPTSVAIPLQAQGEGVCFDGARLVLDSEGVGTPVVAVPLAVPARPRPSATATTVSPTVSPTVSAPSSAPSSPLSSPRSAPVSSADRPEDRHGAITDGTVGVAATVVAALGIAAGLAARRRGRRG